MSHRDLVSVVVAAYNMGQYLREAVESILAQKYGNLEVHIVDDGSTDDTQAVAQTLAADARVKVHRQENQGQARAKNRGIVASKGDFIAFLDADDIWLPGKLDKQLALFRRNADIGVVYSDYDCMDAAGAAIAKAPTRMHRGRISAQLLIENFVCFPSVMVRRECFERCGPFDEVIGMGIDYEMWLRLSPYYDFDYLDEPTVRYRIWGGQMSKNYRRRYMNGIDIMKRFLAAHPGLVSAADERRAWANTYRGRGDTILACEGDRGAALGDYLRALRYDPMSLTGWRAMAKVMLPLRRRPAT